jgi:CHAT domain-containing protein
MRKPTSRFGCGLIALAFTACASPQRQAPSPQGRPQDAAPAAPATPSTPLPPAAPKIAEAIAAHEEKLVTFAILHASGVAAAEVERGITNLSGMIRYKLDEAFEVEEIAPYVREAVEKLSRTAAVREAGAAYARQKAAVDLVSNPDPIVQRELEREAPAIVEAAKLRNVRATAPIGDAKIEEIAARIQKSVGNRVAVDLVRAQVARVIIKKQMEIAWGNKGPLGAMLEHQAAGAAKPFADVFGRMGSVDLKALGPAYEKGYAGQADEAERILRAEFERSEALFRMSARQSAEQSEMFRMVYAGQNHMLDAVLTLTERNPRHAAIARLACEMMLAYKAKSPEVERRVTAGLEASTDPATRDAREQWRAAREQIGTLALRSAAGAPLTAEQSAELVRAQADERLLAARLVELSELGRYADKPFEAQEGLRALRGRFATDEALVSYVEYRHSPPTTTMPGVKPTRSYGAFVLAKGELGFVPVGLGEIVDRAVEAYLGVISEPAVSLDQKRQAAKTLYDLVIRPIEQRLGGVSRLSVVPDALLQLVPFSALHDGKAWVADRLDIRYAFSERALLGEHVPPVESSAPLVLVPGPYSAEPQPFATGKALTQASFPTIPGALAEGRRVQQLLPKARLVTRERATEGALFSARSPSVIHVAGHGVFLPPASATTSKTRGVVLASSGAALPPPATASAPATTSALDPMIASALVLAPDKARKNDGFLTAFEVAAAPLFGTELVVLSACESGRGHPDRVRGIRGLRQAFFTAGVESLVTSLWSVSDTTTEQLMETFYTELRAGTGRAEALRRASAALRAKNEDPFLWAPFVLLGATEPLGFTAARPRASVPGEDAQSRLLRAMMLKRMKRTVVKLGNASVASGNESDRVLDTHLRATPPPEHGPLVLTLLTAKQAVSMVVTDYTGPGRYDVGTKQLRAGRTAVKDPLAVSITKLTPESAAEHAMGGTLDLMSDAPASGLRGTFRLTFKDGSIAEGGFELESTQPNLPAWMNQ